MSETAPKAAFPYKTPPIGPYQREFLRASWARPFAFLNMEQGTGKTWVTINTAVALWLQKKIDAMVVLAPNGVHIAWVAEQLPAHMSDAVPWRAHLWLSDRERAWENRRKRGTVTRQDNAVLHLAQDRSVLAILAVNSEAITIPLVNKAIGTFLTMRRVLFVVDESGDFTKPSGKRTRRLMSYRTRAPYRRCLDGTLLSTEPFELYSPYKFLSPSILGYKTFAEMKEAHAEWETFERGDNGREFKVVARDPKTGKKKWKDLDVLAAKIKPHTFRITKEEALPWLPPKLYNKVYFSMTEEQWRLTHDLLEENTTTLANGGTVTAQNVLTLYLRCQQVACGYVPPDIIYGEETEPVSILPGLNPRLEGAVEHLLRLGGRSTIVWTRFQFDIDILAPRLEAEGFKVAVYDGRTGSAAREAAKADFQAGRVNVFLGNPAAGGRGLNLQRAEAELFYSNYFGLRRRLQAEDRGHRIGTAAPVDVSDMIAYRSIDTVILKALRNNREVADVISGDPHRDWI